MLKNKFKPLTEYSQFVQDWVNSKNYDKYFLECFTVDLLINISNSYYYKYSSDHLYLFKCGNFNIYKIGKAVDVNKRCMEHQMGNPFFLKKTFISWQMGRDTAYKVERAFHSYFSDVHVRGEWYQLEDFDVAIIKAFFDNFLTLLDFYKTLNITNDIPREALHELNLKQEKEKVEIPKEGTIAWLLQNKETEEAWESEIIESN